MNPPDRWHRRTRGRRADRARRRVRSAASTTTTTAARLPARALLALVLLVCSAAPVAGCGPGAPTGTTLSVLASAELTDLRPVLDDLRRATGIALELDFGGTVSASELLGSGTPDRHHLAWLSSDRWLRLNVKAAGGTGTPLSTRTMMSPLVLGVRRSTAHRLWPGAGARQPSWADIAAAAEHGELRYAMSDPTVAHSGLAALVAVATAGAGTGEALRPEDVAQDRVRGFLTGRTLAAPSTHALVDAYLDHQDRADAVIAYESDLLALGGDGRLREPLELVYPQDGIVLSDYPLLLLDPTKRAAYDRVLAWLLAPAAQKKIMTLTLRRPIDPAVDRDPRLERPIGNALYFPDRPEVVQRLLAQYRADTPATGPGPTRSPAPSPPALPPPP
ncbi:Ca-activated chloride channel family protein [Streptomyces sp. TLI_053]|uniref:substrate-binding domain-containing protein n=1 Tax=Streptomyces sp. TLI_053 TaxID=1855352 RepID=UPI0008796CCE|nr:substrate-binding domain-containing protein [Streptomyces sp. TLI_053]SDT82418.1 Ca-activated chloride channel family protein [Streptomyces sp. TLI_053]